MFNKIACWILPYFCLGFVYMSIFRPATLESGLAGWIDFSVRELHLFLQVFFWANIGNNKPLYILIL